ncbi:MAG: precorrin-8X methylmutase [Pseudomonadota bacterium]
MQKPPTTGVEASIGVQRLFDTVAMVDWSAAAQPSKGSDSIWIGTARPGAGTTTENIPTRLSARATLHALAATSIAKGERLLIGFDFPFGYPAGVAKHITGHSTAMTLWRWITRRVRDHADNANNRFDVASEINRLYPGTGPFWGRPAAWDLPDVPTRAKARTGVRHPPERRLADRRAKGAKTVWQLHYAGSVGSQVLMGLPHVLALRDDPELAAHTAIWPLETGLKVPEAQVILAEVYPSLIPPDPSEPIKDAGQVRATADWLAGLDRDGALAPLFQGPSDASARERSLIVAEEAWILGLDAPKVRAVGPKPAALALPGAHPPTTSRAGKPARPLSYERDPAAIYRQSFATVRAEARLDHLPAPLHPVAIRLVHACGMPDITARLAWSDTFVDAATSALEAGAPILCDCEAVAAMVIRSRLPAKSDVICTLNHPSVIDRAAEIGNTRSAAAIHLWRHQVEGAVVVIGNAPTALFHLLECLDQGWLRPAAIIGMPVGFVGAAESKAELARNSRGTPFLTLRGRRGGSALAAAAVNSLAQPAGSQP